MTSRAKVIVLGLDGGTWDLLGPWMDEGFMPNLAKLVREGASGRLDPMLTPCYFPGWASAMTGNNPGKHGVFALTAPGPDGRRRFATTETNRARKLWQILGEQGWTVGVMNLPPSYPPEQVNGYVVTDDSRPPDDPGISYPADFYAQLDKAIGGYQIHKFNSSRDISGYLDRLTSAMKSRRDALCYMMENLDVNFYVMCFEAPERIAYGLWKYLDRREEMYSDPAAVPLREKAIKCFAVIDETFGHAMRLAGEDGYVIIFSCHGFLPLKGFFLADHFLRELGLLRLSQFSLVTRRIAKRLGLAAQKHQQGYECTPLAGENEELIRWKDTLAFTGHHVDRAIYLLRKPDDMAASRKRRDYEKTLHTIKERLLELKDNHGRRAVAQVLTPEEVYYGPYIGEAPDLTVIMADPSIRIKRGIFMRVRSCFQDVNTPWGNQAGGGILAAWGKKIHRGSTVTGASVMDIAPTILHLAGLPVPKDMDGRVLTELMKPALVPSGDAEHAL